jgi:hypothetical protein
MGDICTLGWSSLPHAAVQELAIASLHAFASSGRSLGRLDLLYVYGPRHDRVLVPQLPRHFLGSVPCRDGFARSGVAEAVERRNGASRDFGSGAEDEVPTVIDDKLASVVAQEQAAERRLALRVARSLLCVPKLAHGVALGNGSSAACAEDEGTVAAAGTPEPVLGEKQRHRPGKLYGSLAFLGLELYAFAAAIELESE